MVALTQKRYDMALGRCPCRVGAILYGCPHPKAVRYGIGALPLALILMALHRPLGLSIGGLVVSCGGGDAVTRDSKPQTATLSESTHDGSEPCDPRMTEDLGYGEEGAASPQPPLSKPRQNSGSGDAQTHQVDAG